MAKQTPPSCAVLVPVMRRPQNALPFMTSFNNSGAHARVTAITDPDDTETRNAWINAGANVLVCHDGHTFAKKVNYGFANTTEPWVLLVGDDVIFHPGWLKAAIQAANTRFHVVSTNDMARDDLDALAPHPMIRRSYVIREGASFDGPGVLAHDGYHHWFVDTEISKVALKRDVFVFAPDARIEHLHPIFDKGEWDPIYELGQSHCEEDMETYKRRVTASNARQNHFQTL